jgi:hypothetical protein
MHAERSLATPLRLSVTRITQRNAFDTRRTVYVHAYRRGSDHDKHARYEAARGSSQA